mgnify:CR=1 FL=1
MYLAVFEKGMLQFDGSATPTLVLHREGAEPQAIELEGDAYYNELEFFVDCLVQGRSPAEVIPPESARQSIELVEAERRSSEMGSVVVP